MHDKMRTPTTVRFGTAKIGGSDALRYIEVRKHMMNIDEHQ